MNGDSGKIVMAFGSFDGLQPGHLYYLTEARKWGERLIVAIARDAPVWSFPRNYRFREGERKRIMEACGIADEVILGSEKNPLDRIIEFKPDIVAITPLHPVAPAVLRSDLEKNGLATRVAVIAPYDARRRRRRRPLRRAGRPKTRC